MPGRGQLNVSERKIGYKLYVKEGTEVKLIRKVTDCPYHVTISNHYIDLDCHKCRVRSLSGSPRQAKRAVRFIEYTLQ